MKGISLWQPWATAMAMGLKAFETRGWKTDYRGLIAIHAAKRERIQDDRAALYDVGQYIIEAKCILPVQTLEAMHSLWDAIPVLPRGGFVAVGTLAACHRTEILAKTLSPLEYAFGNHAPGRYAWEIQNIRPIYPAVGFRAKQGIFDVPDEVAAAILKVAP